MGVDYFARRPRSLIGRPGRETRGYWPSQLTRVFQSTKAPLGLFRQAQTCSSKNAGKPYRFGAVNELERLALEHRRTAVMRHPSGGVHDELDAY